MGGIEHATSSAPRSSAKNRAHHAIIDVPSQRFAVRLTYGSNAEMLRPRLRWDPHRNVGSS